MDSRKEHILTMATALFLEKGFYNTSVNDIALACNMSKSTIYKYFSSKEDLGIGVAVFINVQMLESSQSIRQTPKLNDCEKLLEITYLFTDDFLDKAKFVDSLFSFFSIEQRQQYAPFLARFRFQLYNELTQAIAAAYHITDETAAWELTLNFHGLLREVAFLDPEEYDVLNRAVLADFILDSLGAIAQKRHGKPQLFSSDYLMRLRERYSLDPPPEEVGCPRTRLLEDMRTQIRQNMPSSLRKDLLQAVDTLAQECHKASPTPFLIEGLCTYLAQYEPLSSSANALLVLYQDNRSDSL